VAGAVLLSLPMLLLLGNRHRGRGGHCGRGAVLLSLPPIPRALASYGPVAQETYSMTQIETHQRDRTVDNKSSETTSRITRVTNRFSVKIWATRKLSKLTSELTN
jgi:hypothetical protein